MEKALIITPFYKPNIGGAETFAEDLAKALSEKYIVHICTIKWIKPIIWKGMNILAAIRMFFKILMAMIKMLSKYEYERIYALGLIPSTLCVLFRLKYEAIMLALYNFGIFTFIVKWILNKADKVYIEASNIAFDNLVDIGVEKEKIIPVVEWCDTSRFYPIDRIGDFNVLFVGRPIKIKGKYIIEQCQKMIEEDKLPIKFTYVENVPYKDLPKYYQNADICVVPSLYLENFSRVVVEAACCGCIVITSNLGALPEVVEPFGYSIKPTPKYFYRMITEFYFNKKLREEVRDMTIIYAHSHFNQKNTEIFL